jgi:hypothetical protein
MSHMYKSFIVSLVLMVCIGFTITQASARLPDMTSKVATWAYEVFEKDAKWVEKKSATVHSEASKGVKSLRQWCRDEKKTCASEIKKIAEHIGEVKGVVGGELVNEAPETLEAIKEIVASES